MSADADLIVLDVKHKGRFPAANLSSTQEQAAQVDKAYQNTKQQSEEKHGREGVARASKGPLAIKARAARSTQRMPRARVRLLETAEESMEDKPECWENESIAPSSAEAIEVVHLARTLRSKRTVEGTLETGRAVQVKCPDSGQGQLWVHKYCPRVKEDLAVHKKKVLEVENWLQNQLVREPGMSPGNRVLVLKGPSGAGKTAVVNILSREFNCETVEWTTPVPTLWEERLHYKDKGGRYMSKLEEFTEFIDVSMKFPTLSLVSQKPTGPFSVPEVLRHQNVPFSQATRQSQRNSRRVSGLVRVQTSPSIEKSTSVESPDFATPLPDSQHQTALRRGKVLLIEDLPLAADRERSQRLADSLYSLACCARFPTIVIISDVTSERSTSKVQDWQAAAEYTSSLERGGASKISFNPITTLVLTKILTKVAEAEHCEITPEAIAAIAAGSSGDVRHSLLSLQFQCLGTTSSSLHTVASVQGSTAMKRKRKKRATQKAGATSSQALNDEQDAVATFCAAEGCRDDVLGIYHALGKILHNKRVTTHQPHQGTLELELAEEFRRPPMSAETPEMIIAQAHLEAGSLAAHLHENVLEFLNSEAVKDSACIAAYLSDSDLLRGGNFGWRGRTSGIDISAASDYLETDPSRVSVAASASLAARGLLFANMQPSPRRWLSFRGPAMWRTERRRRCKADEIYAVARMGFSPWITRGLHLLAAELHPYARKIAAAPPVPPAASGAPVSFSFEDSADVQSERDEDDNDGGVHFQHHSISPAHSLSKIAPMEGEPGQPESSIDAIQEW